MGASIIRDESSGEPGENAGTALARLRAAEGGAYAGDVSPREAWEYLILHGGAVVDVRTHAEWLFVGLPDLDGTKAQLAQISWKHYPTFAPNPQFAAQFSQLGLAPDLPVFFLCRSGGRSQDAAIAMTQEGYLHCFNIAGGFEGEPDVSGHRGVHEGWKAAGLPWRQG